MTHQPESQPFYARKLYRFLSGGFGLFLISIGFYILLFADTSTFTLLDFVVGVVIVLFGFNMVMSAYKAKESWLSKIGPLP